MTDQEDQREKRPLLQERLKTLEEEQLEEVTGGGGRMSCCSRLPRTLSSPRLLIPDAPPRDLYPPLSSTSGHSSSNSRGDLYERQSDQERSPNYSGSLVRSHSSGSPGR
jgi:hypothetical protein